MHGGMFTTNRPSIGTLIRLALFIALAAAACSGCVNRFGEADVPTQDDETQEVQLFGEGMFNDWTVAGEWLVSPRLDAPDGATRVGVLVELTEAGALPVMEARTFDGDAPSAWAPIAAVWGEEDTHVGQVDLGVGDGASLRLLAVDAPRIRMLRWNAVIPEEASQDSGEDLGATRDALRSELSGIGITSREAWGARPTRCTARDGSRYRFAIHHTVTGSTDPRRQVRGIQAFHMNSRGWCDIGYHFLIGIDGTIYEGRPLHLLGAHVGGNNSGNIGISFVGCFHTSGCAGLGPTTPPSVMINAAGRLLGTLSRLYGITPSSSNVRGHRDHSGQSTTCPGDNLRPRIPEIISIGRSSTLGGGSPAPAPAPAPAPSGGSCRHTYGGTYADGACSASYQCCDGNWRSRGACGACACVESTGERGCSPSGTAPTTRPPAGASCRHTYGGSYANTACSQSYQCCDGTWRTRGACGSCFCVETTGERGCGT
ncbi:MAG: hypothetical protein OHK0013_36740 [Sandaracinaceae bacterium]